MNLATADVYAKFFLYCRTVASTNMNDVSSRSHAIFTILFTQVGKVPEEHLESERNTRS